MKFRNNIKAENVLKIKLISELTKNVKTYSSSHILTQISSSLLNFYYVQELYKPDGWGNQESLKERTPGFGNLTDNADIGVSISKHCLLLHPYSSRTL